MTARPPLLCWRRTITAIHAILVTALCVLPAVAAGQPLGSVAARESLALCDRADQLAVDEQQVVLARGLRLAEAAVAADGTDPIAHFALFCNLGKQMQLAGVSVRSVASVRRLRREIDATLDLAPNYAAALAAKGAFLLSLPRLLGGDVAQAECLLRRAVENDPQNSTARRYLEQALAGRAALDDTHVQLACR